MGPERSFGVMSRTYGLHRRMAVGDVPYVPITRERLGRVSTYFRPYLWQWLAILFLIAITSGLAVLPPFCVRGILDHAIPDGDGYLLNMLVAAIMGLLIVAGLIGVLQEYLNARVGQRIMYDLRNELYQHVQDQSLGFYTTERAGEIVSRINNDVAAVQGVVMGTVVSAATNVFRLTAATIALVALNPQLALICIVVIPFFIVPTRLFGKVSYRVSRRTQEEQAEMVAFMEERLNIGGMMLTKMFGQADADAGTFEERNRNVMDLSVKQAVVGRWFHLLLAVLVGAGPALIYWYGGHQAMREALTVGTLIAFVALLSELYRPVQQLADVYRQFLIGMAVFDRIFEYLDRHPEVEDAAEAEQLDGTDGQMQLEDVCFEYPRPAAPEDEEAPEEEAPPELRPALTDVSFEMRPGEQVALVGPSGAGKTTITYLLPRLYDPTEGRILIDGRDVREVTQDSLREQFAVVTQDTFLFHTTIRENLMYARPEATEEDMFSAARSANIHDFIDELPEGYDTIVGERGFRLSGGEKQRLSIARALLKDPQILILDEATSHLDATSEHLIQQALAILLKGRTAVIIAHRLSTILNADKIVVLDEGRVVEMGTHQELLGNNGLYAALFRQQFRGAL